MRRLELIFLLSASGVGYSPSAAARRDGAIAEATKRGRTASALNIVGGQRKARGELVGERQREAGALLAALKTERASVAPAAGRPRQRPRPSATSPNSSAPTRTVSGRSGGS
jgi:hypothetical protein